MDVDTGEEDRRRRMEGRGAADVEFSDEEHQRLNAEYYEEMRAARVSMGGAAFADMFE